MGRFFVLIALLFAVTIPACDQSGTTGPALPAASRLSNFDTGTIIVYVHWQTDGIPGKTVEILGTDRSEVTDAGGYARFRISPGSYTVRVHEINRGGPVLLYVDFKVTVDAFRQVMIDVVDCLPCV